MGDDIELFHFGEDCGPGIIIKDILNIKKKIYLCWVYICSMTYYFI
jgi:hypothetical protein